MRSVVSLLAMRMRHALRIMVVFAVIGGGGCVPYPERAPALQLQELGAALDDYLARHRGRPVLIAFIAAWSPTAMGPRFALETPEAAAAMRAYLVVPVVADLTYRRELFPTLQRFDRLTPPFMVVYGARRTRPPFVSEYSSFVVEREGKWVSDGAAVARMIREYLGRR